MAILDKKKLKTFFKTGSIPSQDEFTDMIDSLMHQDQVTVEYTGGEFVSMANRLASINAPFMRCQSPGIGNAVLTLEIIQQNAENQTIEIKKSSDILKQYFLGDAPYDVTLKAFQGEELTQFQYYSVSFYANPDRPVSYRLFGNNLPPVSEGLQFGTSQGVCYFDFSKQDFEEEVNLVHSNIRFINSTGLLIEYRSESDYWLSGYTTEDSVTDHYTPWDHLYLFYNADMRKRSHAIDLNVYNDDSGELLGTFTLMPGENYQEAMGHNISEVRNVRIECTRQ